MITTDKQIDEQEGQYGPNDLEAFYLSFPTNNAHLAQMSSRKRFKHTDCVVKGEIGEHHQPTEFSISEHTLQVTIFICTYLP